MERARSSSESAESVQALHTLEQMDRAGVVYSMRVILELPADSIAQTDAGWNALDRARSPRNQPKRCIPLNRWIEPALFIRCASFSNCQRIPLRKRTRDGTRSIELGVRGISPSAAYP